MDFNSLNVCWKWGRKHSPWAFAFLMVVFIFSFHSIVEVVEAATKAQLIEKVTKMRNEGSFLSAMATRCDIDLRISGIACGKNGQCLDFLQKSILFLEHRDTLGKWVKKNEASLDNNYPGIKRNPELLESGFQMKKDLKNVMRVKEHIEFLLK